MACRLLPDLRQMWLKIGLQDYPNDDGDDATVGEEHIKAVLKNSVCEGERLANRVCYLSEAVVGPFGI